METQKFIAYCTKGLERIVQEEIAEKISDAKVIEVQDKRIIFESNEEYKKLTTLKTVDDLGLFISKIEKVEHFDTLINHVLAIDFIEIKQTLQRYRKIQDDTFSLTVGSVGVKNFSAASVKQRLVKEIGEMYQWQYTGMDHTNFDVRVFVDHCTAYISVRLTKESLYVRSYKQMVKPGSLKATIAAAMVMLAMEIASPCRGGVRNNRNIVVDNFCGSGTILCEALSLGYHVYGGDIDPDSVLITKNNLQHVASKNPEHIKLLDAAKTNWQSNFFDYAISNLPWDKQIPVKSITNLYRGCLEEYRRIMIQHGTICLLVTKPELLIKHAKNIFSEAQIETIPISFQGQQPTIVIIRRHSQ